MIVTFLLAVLLGVVLGWLSLRALGWVCLIFCLSFPASGQLVVVVKNSGGSTITVHRQRATGGGGYFNFATTPDIIAGGFGTNNVNWDGNVYDFRTHLPATGANSSPQTWFSNAAKTMIFEWSGSNWVTPPTFYYASGCVTNNTALPMQFQFRTSIGGHSPATMQTSGGQDIFMPGEWGCYGVTNTAPFEYWMDYFVFHPDAGNQAISSGGGGPFNAATNSFPGVGGSGSSGTVGIGAPNNPVGGSSGAGSTTNLTGGQFASGISNLYNVNVQVANLIGQALGNVSTAISNIGGGSNADYTAYFQALTNSSGTATSLLAGIQSQTGTNMFGTNMFGAQTNGLALLSTMEGQSTAISSAWYRVFATNSAQINLGDTLDTSGDWSMWDTGARMSVGNPSLTINLDPRGETIWGVVPWVRLIAIWLIALFAVLYVQRSISDDAIALHYVPGGGPGKGTFSWYTLGMSIVAFQTAAAALPILLMAALSSITAFYGGPVPMPFTSGALSLAGAFASHLRGGIQLMLELFPWVYAVSVVTYLVFFEYTRTAVMIAFMRLLRHTTN